MIKREKTGFTIIELLVAITLMIVLVGMISVIFIESNTIFVIIKARLAIYDAARTSIEQMSKDFNSFIPASTGNQKFGLSDGETSADLGGLDQAKDQMAFRTMAYNTENVPVPVEVQYLLVKENDPSYAVVNSSGNPETIKHKRTIYVLRRIVRRIDDTKGFLQGDVLWYSDICHYVMSYNIEILYDKSEDDQPPMYANIMNVSDYRNNSGLGNFPYPLTGSPVVDQGANAAQKPPIPKAVRITLRIVDSAAEQQERLFIKVFKVG